MSVDTPESDEEKAAHVLELVIPDLVGALLYYDRKEDEDLPRGEIERLIAAGKLKVDDIVEAFSDNLKDHTPCVEGVE